MVTGITEDKSIVLKLYVSSPLSPLLLFFLFPPIKFHKFKISNENSHINSLNVSCHLISATLFPFSFSPMFGNNNYLNNAFHFRADGSSLTVPPENVHIPLPPIGTVVSFSFETHARRDKPVCPKIFRVRTDLVWDDLAANFRSDPLSLNGK